MMLSHAPDLNELPPSVAAALRNAGWTPGGYQPRTRFPDEFPRATRVLDELHGLTVPPLPQSGPLPPSAVEFCMQADPEERHFGSTDHRVTLPRLMRMEFCPIAYANDFHTVLLLSDRGWCVELSIDDTGLFLLGTSLGAALWRMLTGANGVPIRAGDGVTFPFELQFHDDFWKCLPATVTPLTIDAEQELSEALVHFDSHPS